MLVAFAYAFTSYADGNLKGHIVSKNEQEHVSYASVLIKDLNIGGSTDEQGHFTINNIPEGTYTIIISALGYKTIEKSVTIKDDNTADIHFNLEEDLFKMEDVVVSATKTSRSRKDISAVVNVLDMSTFENTSSVNLAEGLNFVPGVRTETTCGNCGSTSLRLNGLEGSYTQILMDSRPVFSGLAGVYGLEQIPASMIERVEVVRGGGSVLFGSNAIGGTVNVITKEPQHNGYMIGGKVGTIDGKSFDRNMNFNTSIVGEEGNSGLYLYGSYRSRDPWNANPDDIYYDEDDVNQENPKKDDFTEITQLESLTAGFKSFYKFGERKSLKIGATVTNEKRRGGNKLDMAPHLSDITEQLEHNIIGGDINYDWTSADNKTSINAYTAGRLVERDSYYGAEMQKDAYGDSKSTNIVSGVQMNNKIGKVLFGQSTLTSGVEHSYEDILDRKKSYYDEDENAYVPALIVSQQHINTFGAFIQNEWTSEKFNLLAGVRLDHVRIRDEVNADSPEKTVTSFNPRINGKYKITPDMQLRAGFSTGFRAPQIFDEDLHIEMAGARAIRNVLDPNLQQERSFSYTFAWDWETYIGSWQAYFLVEGFHTIIKDPFYSQFMETEEGSGEYIFWKSNSEFDQRVSGVNMEWRLSPDPRFNLQGDLTIQEAKFTGANPWGEEDQSVSDRILRTPNTYGSISANYSPYKKLMFSVSGIYTGEMLVPHLPGGYMNGKLNENERLVETDPFFDMSIKATYDFSLLNDLTLQVGGGVKNVFNSYQKSFDAGPGKDAGFVYGPANPTMYFLEVKLGNLW
ncbi:TonB-dependent receptor [Aureibacter tunicatorum]|uniref:Outer membrane receptor for ferrienterochelin and colicins n=1 Tax=Aureibacter tunicatorum TaxID=866807 RepID=A0AAE3XLF9_9BACT|nr:TonB-dependent receptor [Aureibacter tunicatorum]MDR6238670.1 outer membrane receptor for ferrienterochelin and colicins [Aureibacter tunicatorum]